LNLPIIFGDAVPEDPDHDDSQQCENRLEQTAVDFARRTITDVHADDILEDLAYGE